MATSITKKAVITGAGSGIGLAIARRMAKEGIQIVMMGRNYDKLQDAAALIEREGGKVYPIRCDVRDKASVDVAVKESLQALDDVHILVNNAGIAGGGETIREDDAQWEDIIQTNLTGTYYMTKRMLQQSQMLKRGWGRIVSIASTGGKQGVVFAAAYTASKHGIVGLSKSLGLELAKSGVTVNAVCPGFVETDIAVNARRHYARIYDITEDEMKQRIETRVPVGRYIDPEEVAHVVQFLVGDHASGITAQGWNVCGGLGNY
jgi:ketoreductase